MRGINDRFSYVGWGLAPHHCAAIQVQARTMQPGNENHVIANQSADWCGNPLRFRI